MQVNLEQAYYAMQKHVQLMHSRFVRRDFFQALVRQEGWKLQRLEIVFQQIINIIKLYITKETHLC